jgi:pimeloyl-ACP methyl ester carboxylesterase
MVHGYGGNFYSGLMGFLPEALTAHRYVTLAVNMRDHDRGPKKNRFEENLLDIAAGVDNLVKRGHRTIFLHGHSMGTNRVLYYLAQSGDPRIKGVILTGPPGNLYQWNVKVFGKQKAIQSLRQAQELVGGGKGDEWILVDLGPLGKALYTANHVVSLRGPETHSDPFKNITRISKPAIIIHGLADRLADPSVADKLQQSAASESEVTVHKIAGANHRFRGHEDALVEVISQWLLQQLSKESGP